MTEIEAARALDAFNSIIAKVQVPREHIEGAKVIVKVLREAANTQGAVEGRERLGRRLEQLEASTRVAESALADVMRQIGAARDALVAQETMAV